MEPLAAPGRFRCRRTQKRADYSDDPRVGGEFGYRPVYGRLVNPRVLYDDFHVRRESAEYPGGKQDALERLFAERPVIALKGQQHADGWKACRRRYSVRGGLYLLNEPSGPGPKGKGRALVRGQRLREEQRFLEPACPVVADAQFVRGLGP